MLLVLLDIIYLPPLEFVYHVDQVLMQPLVLQQLL